MAEIAESAESAESAERRFGTRLADARRQYGWTQQQVTEAMVGRGFSWSATTATKTEAGSRPIRLDEAVALCELFGKSVDEMVTTSHDAERARLLRELLRTEGERGRAQRAVEEAERELEVRRVALRQRAEAANNVADMFNKAQDEAQESEARNGEHQQTP